MLLVLATLKAVVKIGLSIYGPGMWRPCCEFDE